MSLITFDWAAIAYVMSPLASPWWAQANVLAGFGMFTLFMRSFKVILIRYTINFFV